MSPFAFVWLGRGGRGHNTKAKLAMQMQRRALCAHPSEALHSFPLADVRPCSLSHIAAHSCMLDLLTHRLALVVALGSATYSILTSQRWVTDRAHRSNFEIWRANVRDTFLLAFEWSVWGTRSLLATRWSNDARVAYGVLLPPGCSSGATSSYW